MAYIVFTCTGMVYLIIWWRNGVGFCEKDNKTLLLYYPYKKWPQTKHFKPNPFRLSRGPYFMHVHYLYLILTNVVRSRANKNILRPVAVNCFRSSFKCIERHQIQYRYHICCKLSAFKISVMNCRNSTFPVEISQVKSPIINKGLPISKSGKMSLTICPLNSCSAQDGDLFTRTNLRNPACEWFKWQKRNSNRLVQKCTVLTDFFAFIAISNIRKTSMKRKRKRSDSVLWQKPLHRQKNPKSNMTTQKCHQNFHYTTIADRLRTVSWDIDSHQTGVVKPVNGNLPTNRKSRVIKRTYT